MGREQGGKCEEAKSLHEKKQQPCEPEKSLKERGEKTTEPERGKNVTKATDVFSAFLINFLWKLLLGLLIF